MSGMIVEDGTGLSTAEAYISVADADAYFSKRGISTWTGTDEAKEEVLRRAATYLDNAYRGRWKGYRANETQALAWPRAAYPGNAVGVTDILYDADGFEITTTTVPTQVKHANAEAALVILGGTDLEASLARGGAVKRLRVKAGPVERETEYTDGASPVTRYPVIEGLLRTLVTGQPGASFGNVAIMRG